MIYDLNGDPVDPGEAELNVQLITELEGFLELAKKGEIQAGAYVFVYDNETSSEGWCVRKHGDILDILALLSVLNLKLSQIAANDDHPEEPLDPSA